MPVRTCHLKQIASMDTLYDAFVRQLDLPRHFGRNLDALYDSLVGDVAGPFAIVWHDSNTARQALGADKFASVVAVLESVLDERDDVTLELQP
ncbi:barstar family protein [Crenobacter sp. SG2303]|uniref:Barstar family protein n=1 Tax=Crenobacter oryzisoli TaxID=3056844 RepID=A0ABT7XJ65_9NEIS|nr:MULTISPECIES: barstar family protein [unclassified Crenobacter]MDN0073832.1 barstar family protein [Crenobacter sp. SG2303]MDN0081766.1 barstar family protein [Crenobacter sp. SG2305]